MYPYGNFLQYLLRKVIILKVKITYLNIKEIEIDIIGNKSSK